MSGVLREENSINNLKNFINDISSAGNTYYYFVGRSIPWPDESNYSDAPAANLSYQEAFSSFHDIVFGKLISNTNVSPLIPYIPWANNTVYTNYDVNNANLFSSNFYVVTADYSIYKCIDNNYGNPSTVSPSIKPVTGTFESSDGYIWKYMYTIPSSVNSTFTSSKYVPVVSNTAVFAAAIPGTIDVYRMQQQGTNYQGFNEGIIQSVISPQTIQVANTASTLNNFYVGSSMYLKAGAGSGQISNIVGYQGTTQVATVYPPFSILLNLQLNNITGIFTVGQLVTQEIETIQTLYNTGIFNVGDTLIQSDSQYSGTLATSNSSISTLTNISNNNPMLVANPIYNTRNSGILLATGNVSIANNSNVITSTTANLQTLSINQFVRVGTNANLNIRRISTITSASSATVSVPFNNTLTNMNFYSLPDVFEPFSSNVSIAQGYIIENNLNSLTINYNNVSSPYLSYIIGETIKEYSPTGVDLLGNGIVTFANNGTVILSFINGSMTSGNNIIGQTSNLESTIYSISNYPYITLSNTVGTFLNGFPINSFNSVGATIGTATPVSNFYIPSNDVEYIISPTVTVTGDGQGALAYCIVNTAANSLFEIDTIVPINLGNNYTFANTIITAPINYGSGAIANAVISPIAGHGSDAVTELGAKYVGINMLFDTAQNESYAFPNYGTYYRIGIIKNPLFNQIYLNITPTTRNNLNIVTPTSAFSNGEIILQPSDNVAAKILTSNSSVLQVDHMSGTFSVNQAGNTDIVGLYSGCIANLISVSTLPFVASNQTLHDSNTTTTGILTQVISSSQIVLANVGGKMKTGDTIYDPLVNSYANVTAIYLNSNTNLVSNAYGLKFNQTSRVTLSANAGFQVGERVIQNVTNGNALILDTTHEIDLNYTTGTGIFTSGIAINDVTSGANAIITSANTTYLSLTGVNGTFSVSDSISCITGTGTINNVYPVLVLTDVINPLSGTNVIVGQNSTSSQIPTVINPTTLVKNSGQFIYINDLLPFTVNTSTREIFTSTIQF